MNSEPMSITIPFTSAQLPWLMIAGHLDTVGFPGANAGITGNTGSIPGLGRSPGGGNGNPLKYSYLGNPRDRGAWWATDHRAAKESDIMTKQQHSGATHSIYLQPHCRVLPQLRVSESVNCLAAAAAATKSLQSYPTMCDPRDGSPPGLPVSGILQARTLE